MNAHKLAQEVVKRYFSELDEYVSHSENVRKHLRGPVQAVTVFVYQDEKQDGGTSAPSTDDEEKKTGTDWTEYLVISEDLPDLKEVNSAAYATLGRRAKARLEAFLTGVSITVPDVSSGSAKADEEKKPAVLRLKHAKEQPGLVQGLRRSVQRLPGPPEVQKKHPSSKSSPVLSSIESGRKLIRSISSQSSPTKCPQIASFDLVTRLELYIRSVCRAKCQQQDCVIAAEPPRAMKARAQSIVVAFIETVDNVHQQHAVLTKLLKVMAQEMLAVEFLSEDLCKLIRRIVSDYVQSVSFASLAFLSTPEASANQKLTPIVLKFLRYLQANDRDCVANCELERMLSCCLDPDLRFAFKHIEFKSIGHLLEVCQGFRNELHNIELAPGMKAVEDSVDNNEEVRQALRDLQREVITINGHVLPPVQSRKDLLNLLSQTLNSRTLTSAPLKTRRKSRKKSLRHIASDPMLNRLVEADVLAGQNSEHLDTSRLDDSSAHEGSPDSGGMGRRARSRPSFRLSTVDFLTRRLLVASSRTGTGGDAYFIVRDLFGGEDVEVVPSQNIRTLGRMVRPGSIEISVKLASVTIKCHGSFDVYPKSLVGEVEPLIQVHTTTSETIALQEVRASDTESGSHKEEDLSSEEENERFPVMVVQERTTERTGWRTVSIRPALYEKYEEFTTPS